MPELRDIFTPNDQPTHTYVERTTVRLEQKLRDFFDVRNQIISISGASKTGKTVLLKKVVSEDNLISVSGSSIQSAEDFYKVILSWMGAPSEIQTTTSYETGVSGSAAVEGNINLPIIAQGGGSASIQAQTGRASATQRVEYLDPFSQIIRDVANSSYVIFIDDFHYIPSSVREQIARIMKGLTENGVKFCTASVPHRSEDVVRANPELRGRLGAVDVPNWEVGELKEIAEKGFDALNISIDSEVIDRLAKESFGIPQLMQGLCYNICRVKAIRGTQICRGHIPILPSDITEALQDTANFTDYSSLLRQMHFGPKVRGQERKQFRLADGSTSDVYRAVLLALKQEPARLELRYDEIMSRVASVCIGDSPVGSSIVSSLSFMAKAASDMYSDQVIIEYDEDVLNIADPYLAFFIRCSDKIRRFSC